MQELRLDRVPQGGQIFPGRLVEPPPSALNHWSGRIASEKGCFCRLHDAKMPWHHGSALAKGPAIRRTTLKSGRFRPRYRLLPKLLSRNIGGRVAIRKIPTESFNRPRKLVRASTRGKQHRGRDRKERLHAVVEAPGLRETDFHLGKPAATEPLELSSGERRIGHDKRDCTAIPQVKLSGACEKIGGEILMGGDFAASP
jgi:hypothetical protein